ncbi:DUF1854 domain-containing protein [uncultured Thiodictyon sp.]|uniref:cyanophycin metabolism-associated DUF1854 family protein n=1 Tax=uncultured Thiodictyon sp. TaxID=1846217 RepID=UPI0025FBBCEF|nr:DUF1854 domain-containing protein [uncultured Thiodictyon sp.]
MNATTPPDPDFQLWIDPFGRLVYRDATGHECVDAVPVRAYPITDPTHWVILGDAQGRELRCIEDLHSLPGALRDILEDELARREFVPQIRRVILVSSYLEPAEWEVDTDRGHTRFVLKTEDDVRRLGPHSALIQDSQGVRYLVPDTRHLDPYSRRAVDRYL